jgi:hypothetical protein
VQAANIENAGDAITGTRRMDTSFNKILWHIKVCRGVQLL